MLNLVERKAAGEEIAVQPEAEEDDAPVPDLMAALKASLDQVRDRDAGGDKPKPKAAAKKAPAKKAPAKKPAAKKPAAKKKSTASS